MIRYFCGQERRRAAIVGHPALNGIDFLEVDDDPAQPPDQRQRRLFLHFINDLAAPLDADNFRVEGGERIRDVVVIAVTLLEPRLLALDVDQPGDFSTYTLRIRDAANPIQPPDGIDPILSAIDFSFKVNCSSDFDCVQERECPPELLTPPNIDYLAKDYASFRRLMLDRLSYLMPDWQERNPADAGIALVELLAYVGDYLSYRQDAVATEAYLDTARLRTSVRRHARLVDYHMHNGVNARAWVQVRVKADSVRVDPGTQLLTMVLGPDIVSITPDSTTYREALAQRPEIFETVNALTCYAGHNDLPFYAWGERGCCLPQGAVKATLEGHWPRLKAGDVLILCEHRSAETGELADANPQHRHPVRLTHVVLGEDPLGGRFLEPSSDDPVPITEVEWTHDDALPFALCISSETDDEHGRVFVPDVSIALGNILLADHGQTVAEPDWAEVPQPVLFRAPAGAASPGRREPVPPRFRPVLGHGSLPAPLTHAATLHSAALFRFEQTPERLQALDDADFSPELQQIFVGQRIAFQLPTLSIQGGDGEWSLSDSNRSVRIRLEDGDFVVYPLDPPAISLLRQKPEQALPMIRLHSTSDDEEADWTPRLDLLSSGATATEFVVEAEAAETYIRFGDGRFGRRPEPDERFSALYRVGNGANGNVGASALAHIVSVDPGIERVWNPLPAQGGIDMEGIDQVRRLAPYAFRRQERAVTPADYAAMAERHPDVQRAVATLRWTGSWHTLFVTVDRRGGRPVDAAFEEELAGFLEPFRMAGHDLEIDGPRYVSLEIDIHVCVDHGHFRRDVQAELVRRLSNRILPDGTLGFFHPDRLTFGQTIYLSPLVAAAAAIDGVASVSITRFERQGMPDPAALAAGKLALSRLEIARLDNDPDFPERGLFRVSVEGGK